MAKPFAFAQHLVDQSIKETQEAPDVEVLWAHMIVMLETKNAEIAALKQQVADLTRANEELKQ